MQIIDPSADFNAATNAKPIINVGHADNGQELGYNFGPILDNIAKITRAEQFILKNPFDPKAFRDIKQARDFLVGAAPNLPASLRPSLLPLIRHAAGPMTVAAQNAVRLRLDAMKKLMAKPTQSIPITFNVGGGAYVTATIQNPYIGSGGANGSFFWAITGLETGPLGSTCTAGAISILITQARFAGHEYVNASLGGLVTGSTTNVQTTNSGNAPAGWGAYIFGSDKRRYDDNVFTPWNLSGGSGIVGAVMRETGQATLQFFVPTGFSNTNTYMPFHVHVKATLCGSPFKEPALREMFVPWNRQVSASRQIAMYANNELGRQFGQAMAPHAAVASGMDDELDDAMTYVLDDLS